MRASVSLWVRELLLALRFGVEAPDLVESRAVVAVDVAVAEVGGEVEQPLQVRVRVKELRRLLGGAQLNHEPDGRDQHHQVPGCSTNRCQQGKAVSTEQPLGQYEYAPSAPPRCPGPRWPVGTETDIKRN